MPAIIRVVDGRTIISAGENTAEAARQASIASSAAEAALAASRYFPSQAAGEAGSATGQFFAYPDGAGGLIYAERTVGGSTIVAEAPTRALIESSEAASTASAAAALAAETAAAASETNAAASETDAAASAASAAANAAATRTAAIVAPFFPNGRVYDPQGAVGVGPITPGSGGTNGTFALAFSGGNFAINPTGTFTVAGGVVTAITLTGAGLYLGTAPIAPTLGFGASAGLTGAAATLITDYLASEDDIAVQVGSYAGDGGGLKAIATNFEPELVIVLPYGTTPAKYKSNLSWHGRAQHFGPHESEYCIGSLNGAVWSRFVGNGFTVNDPINNSGGTYYWIAFRFGESQKFRPTSWIGNWKNGRRVDWLRSQCDAVFVKRDNTQPGQFKSRLLETTSLAHEGGQSNSVTAFTDTGVILAQANSTNEFFTPVIGEGIEGWALSSSRQVQVVNYVGDGTAARKIALPITAAAAMVIDATNAVDVATEQHVFLHRDFPAGAVKGIYDSGVETGTGFALEANAVQLDARWNRAGVNFTLLAWAENLRQVDSVVTDPRGQSGLMVDNQTVDLLNFPALANGPTTIEFWGRPVCSPNQSNMTNIKFMPLLMLGEGDASAGTGHDYNGGVYLGRYLHSVGDWDGPVFRWLNSDYFQPDDIEANKIGSWNLNSGVVMPWNRPVHVLVVHEGNGVWRLFLNGQPIKESRQDMQADYGRANGGTGTAKRALALGGFIEGALRTFSGWVYNVAAWNGVALTIPEATIRYRSLMQRLPWEGPAPSKEYDFTQGSMPADVTTAATIRSVPATHTPLMIETGSPGNVTNRGIPTVTPSGGIKVANFSSNPRVWVTVEPGQTYNLHSKINSGNATQITVRVSNDGNLTGAAINVFSVATSGGVVERDDTFTVPDGVRRLYFIGNMAAAGSFTIEAETVLAGAA